MLGDGLGMCYNRLPTTGHAVAQHPSGTTTVARERDPNGAVSRRLVSAANSQRFDPGQWRNVVDRDVLKEAT